MFSEFGKNTLAPLVLRVGLAVILISYGFDKVFGEGTEWGTRWVKLRWAEAHPRIIYLEESKDKAPLEPKEKIPPPKAEAPPPKVEAPRQPKEKKTSEPQPTQRVIKFEEVPIPEILQVEGVQAAVAWGELVGGIALAIGLFTRLAALGITIIQAGAIYTVAFWKGFVSGGFGLVGFEYNLSIIVACLTLILLGGGMFSVDQCLFRRKPKPRA